MVLELDYEILLTDELKTIQLVLLGRLDGIVDQLQRLILTSGCMVRQTLEGDLLLGHQLAGTLVHLRIVDAEPAEDGERLEDGDITVGKL